MSANSVNTTSRLDPPGVIPFAYEAVSTACGASYRVGMTEFREQDLAGARFEWVNLRDATFDQVLLTASSMHSVDLSKAQFRSVRFNGSRMRGVELVDVEISGELQNVIVNGVDIAPLVDAELNRRMPERAKMRPDDSDGFREAWAILERLWKGTVARAMTFPAACASPQRRRRMVVHPDPAAPELRQRRLGGSDGARQRLARGIRWICRGTRRPDGTASRGTAMRDPHSRRCSPCGANARRWFAIFWNR